MKFVVPFLIFCLGVSCVTSEQSTEKGGGLTRDEILSVIQADIGEVRRCYEILLKKSPNTSGRIIYKFTINDQGRVEGVSTKDTHPINDPDMLACVNKRVAGWRFPKPRNASKVEVSYPFDFKPN